MKTTQNKNVIKSIAALLVLAAAAAPLKATPINSSTSLNFSTIYFYQSSPYSSYVQSGILNGVQLVPYKSGSNVTVAGGSLVYFSWNTVDSDFFLQQGNLGANQTLNFASTRTVNLLGGAVPAYYPVNFVNGLVTRGTLNGDQALIYRVPGGSPTVTLKGGTEVWFNTVAGTAKEGTLSGGQTFYIGAVFSIRYANAKANTVIKFADNGIPYELTLDGNQEFRYGVGSAAFVADSTLAKFANTGTNYGVLQEATASADQWMIYTSGYSVNVAAGSALKFSTYAAGNNLNSGTCKGVNNLLYIPGSTASSVPAQDATLFEFYPSTERLKSATISSTMVTYSISPLKQAQVSGYVEFDETTGTLKSGTTSTAQWIDTVTMGMVWVPSGTPLTFSGGYAN